MVGWRNPARYLAPLALAASVGATYAIVHAAITDKHSVSSTTRQPTTAARDRGPGASASSKAKAYVVQPGDTLSKIAAKTGVSVAVIEALNPRVNPNALQPSQKLRLRR